ncbi:alpha/beta hydrolase domain-containing protein [Mycolicibacterium septicum]|uniref:alpha/beta hydrolase domain-containing protein n=1 Tax=Mycolicibacterium septicum TaxID=98668 RepID=UPI0023E12477|nr:alpha/beta hydrolase domain-containing protein [Mycolicibacterium septicum]MDF3336597.1 alpha/beta hydrolase domain-containing protein [Mycolicibacterium septicum]
MVPSVTPIPGKPNLLLGAYDLATVGYGAEEFFVSGTARSYSDTGASEAGYTTRIVVLRPTDAAEFNGVAMVEWLNVSGGIDAPAVWFMAHREIVRAGYVYVAVSAQYVGIEGGDNLVGADMSLKAQHPERYSDLHHPGDAFAYDIFTQIGRLVRDGAIGGLDPETILVVGESQSAMFLTTYVNDVDPEAAVFDGFLVHSRFGSAASLDGNSSLDESRPVPFRDDVRVPVLTVLTETDVVDGHLPGYHRARRPDAAKFRAWEIAGTSHADNYTIRVGFIDDGSAPLPDIVAAYAPTDQLMGTNLSYFINFAPQHHYVLQAAVAGLTRWVRAGQAPVSIPPLALTDIEPVRFALDANGIVVGGVRTPWVDVPIARTSGLAPNESPMSFLFGSGEPFDATKLRELYPGGANEYLEKFTAALDRAIEAGVIVPADRAEILELAASTLPT